MYSCMLNAYEQPSFYGPVVVKVSSGEGEGWEGRGSCGYDTIPVHIGQPY